MVAVLVAGPVIRKIRAAPGESPAAISAYAIGIDAVAQMYSGRLIAVASKKASGPVLKWPLIKSGGSSVVISPASARPTSSAPARSAGRLMKP